MTTKQTALPSHTPGPWTEEHFYISAEGDLKRTWQSATMPSPAFEIICKAAAVPDLLSALEIAIATIERLSPQHRSGGFCSTRGTLDVCQMTLKKARGTNA